MIIYKVKNLISFFKTKTAIKAFATLLRLKSPDLKQFIEKVLENINKSFEINNIDCLKSYSIQIVAILDYYTSIKDINFELMLSLHEKIRINYENLLRTNTNCILEYTDFIFNTLKIGNKSESIISI